MAMFYVGLTPHWAGIICWCLPKWDAERQVYGHHFYFKGAIEA